MHAIAILASIGGSTFVVLAYLIFIWWLDRYEREPLWVVFLTMAYGGIFGTMLGCFLSLIPGSIAGAVFGAQTGGVIATVLVAPVVEEFTKALVFGILVLTRHFDNETDGLIYGAATGLGFAVVENVLYFALSSNIEELVSMAFIRTLFTAIVHCVSSASIGMAIGFAVQRRDLGMKLMFVVGGYLIAVINHGVWNGLATLSDFTTRGGSAGVGTGLFLLGCGLVILASFVMFGLTQFSLNREHEMIRRHLLAESQRGTIPAAHAEVIPYWLRRRKSDWLPTSVPKDAYVEAATLLAFRHHQLGAAEGAKRQRIVEDIESYRAQIDEMLSGRIT